MIFTSDVELSIPCTIVKPASKVQDAGLPAMSEETIYVLADQGKSIRVAA